MSKYYNVDISVLTAAFEREQQEYYQQTVVWADIHPSQLRGAGVPFKSYDLLKVTVQELKEALKVRMVMMMHQDHWCCITRCMHTQHHRRIF